MHRKLQIRNSDNPKATFKAPLKVHLEKLPLECISSRTSNGGFVSGMTLDEYFSTVRQNTQPSSDSECSSLALLEDRTIREIEEENESSCNDDVSSSDTARGLQSNRQRTQRTLNNVLLKIKLPAISHQSFTKRKRVDIPPLSLSKTQQKPNFMRSLYGGTNFKKPVFKPKKENLQTLTVSSFESKLKKRIFTRRDNSELFPPAHIKLAQGGLSVAETTSRRQ